jgi:hypothetical protein
LDERGGTVLRQALAQKLGESELRMPGLIAALRRILNVDGYSVVSVDDASGSVVLNRQLLEVQFELSQGEPTHLKKIASASLIWSPDLGMTLIPQKRVIFGEGKVNLNAIITVAADKQHTIDFSRAVVEWLQPPIRTHFGGVERNRNFGEIKRPTTIMITTPA